MIQEYADKNSKQIF